MATLASDPSLTKTTVAVNDLIIALSPVVNTLGQTTGYKPYNITAANFSTQIVAMGLLSLGQTLPTTAPEGGGLWMNNGQFAYSAVTGTASGIPLTTEALKTSLANLLAILPTSNPGVNGEFYNNSGIVNESYGADVTS